MHFWNKIFPKFIATKSLKYRYVIWKIQKFRTGLIVYIITQRITYKKIKNFEIKFI